MKATWYEFKAKSDETEILLYDEIGGFGISASAFVAELQSVPKNHRLVLRIHSPGGSVLDGNVIANAIKAHPGGVTTHIDGLAASMASVLAIAGRPARMAANGLLMIHNVSGGVYGDSAEMRRTAALMEKVQESVIAAYVNRTGKPRDVIVKMMDDETWMNAEEAKAFGFVDSITAENEAMAAKFDLSKFRNARKFDTTNNQHIKPMIIETPEYLALIAEHKIACEQGVTLKANFEALTAEKTDLSAKLSEATNKLTDADKAITELKASIEKTAAEHAAALSDFDKKVSAKAATMLAQTGTTPVVIGSPAAPEPNALIAQFDAIKDPIERTRFYRANKAAIDATFRK